MVSAAREVRREVFFMESVELGYSADASEGAVDWASEALIKPRS